MDDDLNSKIREMAEKMEEEGRPMINLSRLFISEPLSLEALLMLEGEGPMTTDQVFKEFTGDTRDDVNVTHILDMLKGFDMIVVKDNVVGVTDRGKCIVMKLRKETNNFGEDNDKLCNVKHDCIYNDGNC
jgi:hypothetical protein